MDAMDTGSNLDDLLHKAEQLTASIDGNVEMPRIERNLKQLLDAGDQMWVRTASASSKDVNDVRASVLLGSKGFDLQKVSQHLDSLSTIKKTVQVEAVSDCDIRGFLKKKYENAIVKTIETVRSSTIESTDRFCLNFIQKDWEERKSRILNALVGPDEIKELSFDMNNTCSKSPCQTLSSPGSVKARLYFDKTFIDKTVITSMNASELAFAKEVVKYVDQVVNTSLKSDMTKSFNTMARNIIGETSIIDLWNMVSTIISSEIPQITENDPLIRRNNYQLNNYFLSKSCQYLELKFVQSMQGIVNVPIGQPINGDTIYSLVKDYLNIKTPYYSNMSTLHTTQTHEYGEDGLVDGVPVWCFIFYCLRSGSIDAAINVTQKMNNNNSLKNELVNILKEYRLSNDGYLSRRREEQLKLYYQRTVRLSSDVYKKSVYSIFARCASDEFYSDIFDKVDDFLWIKLKKVTLAEGGDDSSLLFNPNLPDQFNLAKLKKVVIDDLGEQYFDAQDQPFLYFRALFLTLQWEAAIEFLFRFEPYRCYALHVALAVHEHNLIIPSQHDKLAILSKDNAQIQRLNLAKLISIYTKKFEMTNTVDVIYYYYFLHDLRSPSGEPLFNSYVSQLVRQTKQYETLLGYVNSDGVRVPGAIDKFSYDADLIITQVAIDLENDGLFEDSVQLYDLAGNHTKVLSLLNKMLCPLISQQKGVDTKREKIETLTIQIAERYFNQKCTAPREIKSTFYLLIDLMTFFDHYHIQHYNEALDVSY